MMCLYCFTSLIVWHFSVDSISKPISDNENEMEYYLSHPDRNVRLILTKFTLSEHKLLIEIGRNLKIPRNQRLCAICNVLEDEFPSNPFGF
jgi:hypothetical protein